ncbi:MAG: RNA polymerase sigma factor [Pseudomonadota bacterium]
MAEGKQQFINRLFREQGPSLVKYLTARFRDRAEAEEVAQEAWLRMYRLDHPETLANARAFLFQTASNLGIDRVRRLALERRHGDYLEQLHNQPQPAVDQLEERIAAEEAIVAIEDALYELPLKCRQAFMLHRRNGWSYPQIAEQLDVSTSMVEKYISQALKHFRNKLEQNFTEG